MGRQPAQALRDNGDIVMLVSLSAPVSSSEYICLILFLSEKYNTQREPSMHVNVELYDKHNLYSWAQIHV